jgi:spermidine synthase
LKSPTEKIVVRVVVATGISSVVTQLYIIREYMSLFRGNELVIALILFNWLVLGGIGTLLAHRMVRRSADICPSRLGWLSFALCGLAGMQIIGIRVLRNVFFTFGSSIGFYPTFLYTFSTMAPYALLIGWVLPFSLFVIRRWHPAYAGARIYIADNLGDILGGVAFSFLLVFWFTPLQAITLAQLPLLAASWSLLRKLAAGQRRSTAAVLAVLTLLGVGLALERPTLNLPQSGLADYRETPYGRIAVYRQADQYTLYEDGIPVLSTQNIALAEEAVHYPLCQLENPRQVLIVSVEAGMPTELEKYRLERVDYVELNPALSEIALRFGLIRKIPELRIVQGDGRAFLRTSSRRYDAVLVNLPEPETFQTNRFYTERFFQLARSRLAPHGILSFAMEGYANYVSDTQRRKLSSLYNTARAHFKNVLLLPGQRVFFLCSDRHLTTAIPAALEKKGIASAYIAGFFEGNLPPERIAELNGLLDPAIPVNRDVSPFLMRVMFSQWFAKFGASPWAFIVLLTAAGSLYLLRRTREELILFSTGCAVMGSEILVIFAFQIFFGYIYLQIGLIVTTFLAGLLPGAYWGTRLRRPGKNLLAVTDIILICLLLAFIPCAMLIGDRLPVVFFLTFGFATALLCGLQFPQALKLKGDDNQAASRMFSADLMGAAWGTLFTSACLIPLTGIWGAAVGLAAVKAASLILCFQIPVRGYGGRGGKSP